MAITFVGSTPVGSAIDGGNVTLNLTGASGLLDSSGAQATLLQNDVVFVAYGIGANADFAMATTSSGWTKHHENYYNRTSDANFAVFYKIMGSTPDTSFVAVGNGNTGHGTLAVAFAFRGVDSTVFDVTSTSASLDGGSRPDPPSITPVTSGAWILAGGAGATGTAVALTNPGDLSTTTNHFRSGTVAEALDCCLAMGIKTNWTSGAFDPAMFGGGTNGAGDSWCAITIALKPVGGPVPYTITITPGSLPIGGASVTVRYGRSITITPSSVPITGSVVQPLRGKAITITAGSLPIAGAGGAARDGQGRHHHAFGRAGDRRGVTARGQGDRDRAGRCRLPGGGAAEADYSVTMTPSPFRSPGRRCSPPGRGPLPLRPRRWRSPGRRCSPPGVGSSPSRRRRCRSPGRLCSRDRPARSPSRPAPCRSPGRL